MKFNAPKFIQSAVSDDKTRPFMMHPYYDAENKRLVATDGRRLHMWQDPPFTSDKSTYVHISKDLILPVEMEYQFPNYQLVIPEGKELGEPVEVAAGDEAMCIPRFFVTHGVRINLKYLSPLFGNGIDVWTVKFNRDNPKERACTFVSGPYTVVIMPFLA